MSYLKHLEKGICIMLFPILFFSCHIQKNITNKKIKLPERFEAPDSVLSKLDSMIIPRDLFFKDTLLVQLIDSALKNNFDQRRAEKDMLINKERYKQSKASFYPQINLNLFSIQKRFYSKNYKSPPNSKWYSGSGTASPPENLYVERQEVVSSLALDWELDIWGKIRDQKREAYAYYQQSQLIRRVMQTELVATVSEYYYHLLSIDEQMAVAVANYQFRDSTLSIISLLYKSGEISALGVQQAKTQVLEAVSLISKLKEQQAITENNLRLLIGALPDNVRRRAPLQIEDSTYNEVNRLPLYLVQNRPDVLVAKYGLAAANANVGVTQKMRFPSLTISLDGGVNSLLPKNWFDIPGSLFGGILAGISDPILNKRKLKTDYEVAKLERDQAEINFQKTVYSSVVDVENVLISIKRLREQMLIANEKQNVARNALDNSRLLFRSGFANYLEVITAQSEALTAELDLARLKSDLFSMRIQLYRALGGGWQ